MSTWRMNIIELSSSNRLDSSRVDDAARSVRKFDDFARAVAQRLRDAPPATRRVRTLVESHVHSDGLRTAASV